MFCILHISRSYPLDCYDYWSTSGANKQPRYIRRRKRGRKKRNKIFLNEFDAKRSSLISVSALKKTAAQHRKNFQKLGCSPKLMQSLLLVPWGFKKMLIKSFFPHIFLTKKYKYKYITPHFHYWLLEPSVRWCWKGSSPVWWRVRFATASLHTPPILRWIFDDLLTWAEMPFHAAVQTPDQISEQCSRNLVKIVKIWSKELVNVVKYCKTWSKNKISSKSRSVFCCRDMGGFKS